MKTVSQYKEDIKSLMKKVADMDAQAIAENRDPNGSEVTLKNEILDTVDELNRTVKTLERQERVSNSLEASSGSVTMPRPTTDIPSARDKKDKFQSLGQQMVAVVNAGRPGGGIDPRLYNAAASGLSETVQSDGGLI